METEHQEWENIIKEYPSATQLFNYFLDDPLLDYLDIHGQSLGFTEEQCPQHTLDLMNKGSQFENLVIKAIREKGIPVIEVNKFDKWGDGCFETLQLMKEGYPIIFQSYIVNHENKTKGHPDILIRSDYLNLLKPGLISDEHAKIPSLFGNWHYRVIDIKMSNIALSSDTKKILNNKLYKGYKAQVLVYTLAIGSLQHYVPDTAYILGRSAHNYDNSYYVDNCFDSISSIRYNEHDFNLKSEFSKVLKWRDILKTLPCVSRIDPLINNGNEFYWESIEQLIPSDLNISLRPNMKNKYDYKWNSAKKIIAYQRQELTLLWNCGITKRNLAISNGIKTWDDYKNYCLDKGGYQNSVLAQILDINSPQNQSNNILILPKDKLEKEMYELLPSRNDPFLVIDFETTNNLNDDFSNLPEKGGDEMIFLIGITVVIPRNYHSTTNNNCPETEKIYYQDLYEYRYFPFFIKNMYLDDECKILRKMIKLLNDVKLWLNMKEEDEITLYHWSNAEPSFFNKMFGRQYDFLSDEEIDFIDTINFSDILYIFKYQPIIIKDAFDFSIKTVGGAMYKHGMIKTIWSADANGLSVMLDVNKYSIEADKLGINLRDFKEINEIIIYNMIDCQVLAEIIIFLQNHFIS
jgi:hypothetical protein